MRQLLGEGKINLKGRCLTCLSYTEEFKQTILDLHKQGKTARQLAAEYEVGYSTILKWVQGSIPIWI